MIGKILLVGGGHTHALVLKAWHDGGEDLSHVTVISDSPRSPYSGMLTGFIAGLYREDEIFLDIENFSKKSGARFVCARVNEIDFKTRMVSMSGHDAIAFDVLSVNTGGTPVVDGIDGADDFANPVKPIQKFQKNLTRFLENLSEPRNGRVRIVQVGGGIAGIECAMGFESRCRKIGQNATITLIDANSTFLPHEKPRVRKYVARLLAEKGIHIKIGDRVSRVLPDAVVLASGESIPADFIALSTQVTTPSWIQNLKLKHDGAFIAIDDTLRTSIPHVFASGDVARNPSYRLPRAGVYAVRQAKILAANLLRTAKLSGKDAPLALTKFRPQSRYLKLVMDGAGRAFASRGFFFWPNSKLMWRIKDHIDRKFVSQFQKN